ncbi:MAG: FAD:protein FMN transferase [Planctomycetota bacterium]|jgi:thiamine biosynthesis lipoprotein
MTQPQPEISFVKSDWDSISGSRRFSHEAMATTFEVIILHEDARYAQQASRAAFDELDRLEAELSRFIENSDISRINNLAANQPLPIGLDTFECLRLSARMYDETNGAFDITIGSLFGCLLNEDKTVRKPSKEQLNIARRRTGTHLLKLDEAEHTIELSSAPVQIDLGAIGKGYAVDRMAELLRDWGIDTALIHGGYSSVLALNAPPDTKGWPLTLSDPAGGRQTLACLCLQNRALSGSGLQIGRHIIDPRTAQPVMGKRAAWTCAADAATADALSTAFMVMTPDEIEQYCLSHPDVIAMVVTEDAGPEPQKDRILRYGLWKEDELLKQ